jgi:hypothetical protein
MKIHRNAFRPLLLVVAMITLGCSVTVRASGGVMEMPPAPAPEPTPTAAQAPSPDDQDESAQTDTDDSLTEAALSLVQMVLSLL